MLDDKIFLYETATPFAPAIWSYPHVLYTARLPDSGKLGMEETMQKS